MTHTLFEITLFQQEISNTLNFQKHNNKLRLGQKRSISSYKILLLIGKLATGNAVLNKYFMYCSSEIQYLTSMQ